MRSCSDCPKRATCESICPEVEKQLPDPDAGRSQARFDPDDRAVAWRVQDHEDELSPRRRLVARLYYRFGLSEQEIADALGVRRHSVSEMLCRLRKRILRNSRISPPKTPNKSAYYGGA